ncbi:MAG TPA: serine hydrolase [Acetobacteraceae bacterium]|nr:serine hydrolase [Acetobacteraceae bacterium]
MSEPELPDRVDPMFDRTPPFAAGDGPPDPVVYDGSAAALRQRVVNFAAKRFADMLYVSGLDRATAERHFRWRPVERPGSLGARPAPSPDAAFALLKAQRAGRIAIASDDATRTVTVRWQHDSAEITGRAVAPPGYGGILLGPAERPRFDPAPIARAAGEPARPWPVGDAVETPRPLPAVSDAADALFAASPGLYGILIATPERVLFERYSAFGAPDRATPSWSMGKAVTCTVIGRLIQEGWLRSPYDPARAPLWRDPRAPHQQITLDHLLRMRSGLGMPVLHEDGRVTLGFENSAVYHDAADAFDFAQRQIVATVPGSVFRYVNSGINVLGAIIRAEIEKRGLPYHAGLYSLLADRLGMRSFQHSADIAGNLIASGAAFATLRDYAKLGVLYLRDGVWKGERLLPAGWADYALRPTHSGSSYAACFRSNADRFFPQLPADAAWASGASEQRIVILRRQGLTAAIANETDHPIDHQALGRTIAAAIDSR